MKHTIKINKRSGEISWLTHPPFDVPCVDMTRKRFSEIIPCNLLPRLAFRALRFLFGEDGKVAAFTRGWLVMWRCTILQGPHKGESRDGGIRSFLIDWEHEMFADSRHKGMEKIV